MPDLPSLVADLNPPQREAVEWGDGPLLIVAGAGSGKTRVITRRVAHLIGRGVPAEAILAITFTNKAAGEMRERVAALVGEGRVVLGTFHGFCARVLRSDGRHVGLPPGFTIYDRDDQVALVKDIARELSIDPQHLPPRSLLAAISRWKNDGLPPEELAEGDGTPFGRVAGQVYGRYARALAEAGAADFDDLLLLVTRLFREREDVLLRYRERFRHVLVDEYQDTNLVQYRLARDIAAGTGNLCATGDPDQSIYRWRGARIRNILEFSRDFPGAHVVRLEQNYRSTGHILAAASAVIARNPGRLMGPLWSELGEGRKVVLLSAEDEEAEADQVVRRALALHREGLPLRDIAVFYRTNALSRGLERALRLLNVPYDIVGAVEFYERKEVKDLLAYLRVLCNPADALSFLRIVNVPARGLGKASLERLRAWGLPLGLSPREAARRAGAGEAPEITGKARAAFAQVTALLDGLADTLSGPVEDTFREVVQRAGYLDYLRDFGGQEASDRIDNVGELEGALAAYVRAAGEPSVSGFLQETALLSDADAYDPNADRLTLMTLHAAKGLEFPAVFVVGLEEGLLPHARTLDDEEDVQEERRLFYVGMTRAQRHLTLSCAARRATFGSWMPTVPSRFLDELPAAHVVRDDRVPRAAPAPLRQRGTGAVEERAYVPDPEDYLDVEDGVRLPRPGAAVRHAHFGQGVVLDVRGSGGKARITVRFERFGDKQLMAEYARLEEVF
ncbi:MAG: ATP-dependent DNA helicase PcrA [Planctomycetes bacterium]|nr:ATP-dependent DNA helicase PcrA [Planctomycetota bacterium]